MKNDRYFPLEICFWAGDNLSVMIYQIGGVQLVGFMCCCCICVQRMTTANQWLIVCKNQWKKSAVEKNSENCRWIKGKNLNETQESRVEEKYYYCCKQQQQYWRGKEDCCCCCSDFGFGE